MVVGYMQVVLLVQFQRYAWKIGLSVKINMGQVIPTLNCEAKQNRDTKKWTQNATMHSRNGVHRPHLVPAYSVPNSSDQSPVAPVTLRSARGDFAAMTRSGSYMHPFLHGHGGRSHERSHAIHHHHQSTNPLGMPAAIIPSMVRFHGRRTPPPPPAPANSISDHNGGFFIVLVGGSSMQNSVEGPANAVFNRNDGFLVVPPRGSSVQSSQQIQYLIVMEVLSLFPLEVRHFKALMKHSQTLSVIVLGPLSFHPEVHRHRVPMKWIICCQ